MFRATRLRQHFWRVQFVAYCYWPNFESVDAPEGRRAGGQQYSDERLDCRSDGKFEELIDHLTFFQVVLNAKTDAFVTELEEARQDFQEEREQHADAHAEEYKERWREARHEDESIAGMFGSLKSDRDS